jgi:hypothetical protein
VPNPASRDRRGGERVLPPRGYALPSVGAGLNRTAPVPAGSAGESSEHPRSQQAVLRKHIQRLIKQRAQGVSGLVIWLPDEPPAVSERGQREPVGPACLAGDVASPQEALLRRNCVAGPRLCVTEGQQ